MFRKRLSIAASIASSLVVFPGGWQAAPASAAAGAQEKNYSTPGGFEYTVGFTDLAARPTTTLNGMPTNREVFLDNTSYGRFTGPGSGKLETGYLVACAVDIDPKVKIEGKLGFDASADAGLSIGLDALDPSIDLSVGPDLSGGIGFELSMAPGKIVKVAVTTKNLTPGATDTSTAATSTCS